MALRGTRPWLYPPCGFPWRDQRRAQVGDRGVGLQPGPAGEELRDLGEHQFERVSPRGDICYSLAPVQPKLVQPALARCQPNFENGVNTMNLLSYDELSSP